MHLLRRVAVLLALLFGGHAAWSAPYEELLDSGKAALAEGDPAQALVNLQEAHLLQPEQFEPYLYLAIASYRMGDDRAAEEFAIRAGEFATVAQKPLVTEVREAISRRAALNHALGAANDALDAGLLAKAARLYQEAFELNPEQTEAGLKAAELLATRLEAPLDAAAIWQRIAASTSPQSAEARARLEQWAPTLDAIFREQLERANGEGLLALAAAFPDRKEPFLVLADAAADSGDEADTTAHLAEAIKRGATVADITENERLRRLLAERETASPFGTFIADAFGPSVQKRMLDRARVERRERERAEAQRQNEKRLESALAKRTRLENERWAEVDRQLAEFHARMYQIGESGPAGGVIIYDKGQFENGWRYLEAAPAGWGGSEDPEYAWGAVAPASKAVENSVGWGFENTQRIVNSLGRESAAAVADAFELRLGGTYYGNWHLPSRDELPALIASGQAGPGTYWTSTEIEENALAWAFKTNGRRFSAKALPKVHRAKVRPVRYVIPTVNYRERPGVQPAKRGLLGVRFFGTQSPVSANVGSRTISSTCAVYEVEENTPAEAAGLREGDYVVAIDHFAISTIWDAMGVVPERAGKPVTIRIVRGDQELEVIATPMAIDW